MSYGNFTSAFCEDLHGRIIDEFHLWRKEKNLPPDVTIDGILLGQIIARAKIKLYKERPDSKDAGYNNYYQNDINTLYEK